MKATTHLDQEIKKRTIRFVISGLLILAAAIGLSVIWNRSIENELAAQAASFIRKGIVSKEMRGVSEYLNGVQFSAFETVTLYRADGEHIITLPPIMDRKARETSLTRPIFYGTIKANIYLDTENKNLVGRAIFTYPRFELVPYAIIVWFFAAGWLAILLRQARGKVEEEFERELRLQNAEVAEEIAKKVRHNIRAPLAVLKALFIDQSVNKDEFFGQGQNAVIRLEEIVAELKSDYREKMTKKASRPAIHELTTVIKAIVSEKKLIAKNVNINFRMITDDHGIYTEIPASALKANLSNLIDNSLQAISGNGTVDVTVDADSHLVTIEISDSGCGIPSDIIPKIFDKEFTYEKHGGSGLGLYYAKKLFEDHQGNIDIQSEIGKGTKVVISVPRSPTPSWHLDRLDLSRAYEIAVCDDQSSIRLSWENRFKALNSPPQALFFESCEEMVSSLDLGLERLYLVDYDLGSNKITGLDFLKQLNKKSPFVLVTGHFDEPAIQDRCSELGCKLISKDGIFQIEIA